MLLLELELTQTCYCYLQGASGHLYEAHYYYRILFQFVNEIILLEYLHLYELNAL